MEEDNLLKKWLNNNLTDAETKVFSERDDYALNQDIINKAQHFKASHFSKVDDFKTFKKAYENPPKGNRLQWIKPLLRVASILIIGFAVYFTVFSSNEVETQTLAREQATIRLPDLSSVTLNADSKIVYDKATWAKKRDLNLEGEAYFKVTKGQTFNVITNNGIVSVIGTEFNVQSRNNYFEVKCYEGLVSVTSDTITRQLSAGETFRILNRTFTEAKTKASQPNWTNNRSAFKAIPLQHVIKELERQYNVKITFKNVDNTRFFTGAFVHNDLENALISITKPMNLTFKISTPNQVLIYGETN